MPRNDLAEGIQAGTALAAQINNSIDQSDDREARKQALADQLAMEQRLEEMRSGSAASLESQRLAGEMQLQGASQTAQDARQQNLLAWNAQHDKDMENMRSTQEDKRAARGSHALEDQFNSFQDTLDTLQQNAKAAAATGDPDALASANRRLAQWQQMGPGLLDTAKKDQGFSVSVDPNNPKESFKVTGKVNSIEEALKLRDAMNPQPTDSTGMGAALDDAIKAKQLELSNAVGADPTNAHTFGDYLGMGGQSHIAKARADLQALQQQRAALAPARAVMPGMAGPTQPAVPTLDPSQTTMAPAPAAVQQMSAPTVNPAQTGQSAFQGIQEGQTATNRQTGQKMIYKGGAWQPLTQ